MRGSSTTTCKKEKQIIKIGCTICFAVSGCLGMGLITFRSRSGHRYEKSILSLSQINIKIRKKINNDDDDNT